MMRLLIIAAALAAAQSAWAGYLPEDSFGWWETAVPRSGAFRQDDSLAGWFDDRLARHYDFSKVDPNALQGLRVSTESGADVTRRKITRIEQGTSITETVLVNGPEVRPDEDGAFRPAMQIDFSIPQRAVVLEYGFLCNSDYDCTDSDGAPGIDALGVELVATDRNGQVIGRSSGEDTGPFSLQPGRADYRIGVRDQHARIVAVRLELTHENARTAWRSGARTAHAVQILSKIHHEALPHAAVLETELTAETEALELQLPFALDRATAIIRGFSFADDASQLRALRGFDYEIDVLVDDGSVSISATGGAQFAAQLGDDGRRPIQLFISVIAWDSRQTQLEVGRTSGRRNGVGTTEFAQYGTDPCVISRGCGSSSADSSRSVAATTGFDYLLASAPDKFGRWNEWNLNLVPSVFSDQAAGQISSTLWLTPDRRAGEGQVEIAAERAVLTGESIVLQSNAFPESYSSPATSSLPRYLTDSAPSYDAFEFERRGLNCLIDAPVAAVGLRHLSVRVDTNGGRPSSKDKHIRGLDAELSAIFRNGSVSLQLAGGVDTGESLQEFPLDGDHGQIFAAPLCFGLKISEPAANAVTRAATFVSSRGQPTGAFSTGSLTNIGQRPLKVYGAAFDGDSAEFDLFLESPGGRRIRVSDFQHSGPWLLDHGQSILVDGEFKPTSATAKAQKLRFQTDQNGGLEVEVPINGRTSDLAEAFPQRQSFGVQTIGGAATRQFHLVATDVYSLQLLGFRVEDDVNGAFRVSQPGAPVLIQPGGSALFPISYVPSKAGEDRARIIAQTNVGDFAFDVHGIGALPPVAQLVAEQRELNFGLHSEGRTTTMTLSLHSSGRRAVTLGNLTLAGDAQFELVNPPAAGQVLLPEERKELIVRFRADRYDPSDLTRGASLIIDSDAAGGTVVVPLRGSVAPAP